MADSCELTTAGVRTFLPSARSRKGPAIAQLIRQDHYTRPIRVQRPVLRSQHLDMTTTPPSSTIDSCDYLYVREIRELDPQALYLLLEEGRAAAESETRTIGNIQMSDVHPIRPTGRLFELFWKHYIAYCVRNESYCGATNNEEIAAGEKFRIYSKSHFLHFISRTTFASAEYPGPFQHYCILSENHVVDIVAVDGPQIREQHR